MLTIMTAALGTLLGIILLAYAAGFIEEQAKYQ